MDVCRHCVAIVQVYGFVYNLNLHFWHIWLKRCTVISNWCLWLNFILDDKFVCVQLLVSFFFFVKNDYLAVSRIIASMKILCTILALSVCNL